MKNYFKIFLLFLPFLFISNTAVAEVKVNKFRFSVLSNKSRLVFDATAPIKYSITPFQKRIIVEIKRAKLATKLNVAGLSKTPVSAILSACHKNNLRLIINLKKSVEVKHFLLSKPNRLVLDLYSEGGVKQSKVAAKSVSVKETAKKTTNKNNGAEKQIINKITKASATGKKLRDVVIVIDPGHGGKDSGAIGYRKTLEKNVTLVVAKQLQKNLNNMPGFKAVLTRKGDCYVSLRTRLAIARKNHADMFVSLHADAYLHRRAHGASVFALSQRGATSEAARWLAKKENESELGKVISDKSDVLRSVLLDLAQTATISASLEMGKGILNRLSKIAVLHSKGVEQAAFVVLKAPDIPSILIELGFISHKKEENNLRSAKYRKKLADQIAQGVRSYFSRRPPSGTRLATS